MANACRNTLQQLARLGRRTLVVLAGDEASEIREVLRQSDFSSALLDVYAFRRPDDLNRWLGREMERFCSPETALSMSALACRLAMHGQDPTAGEPLGIGFCAAASGQRSLRVFVAAQSPYATQLHAVLHPATAQRPAASKSPWLPLLLDAMQTACGNSGAEPPLGHSVLKASFEQAEAPPLVADVWRGAEPMVWSLPGGELRIAAPAARFAVLSGAFDPLHMGHRALRDAAETHLGMPVYFEMPIINADKPPLDFLTIAHRRRQFRVHPLALSCAPTFAEKAEFFRGSVFVVGVDTAERILQPRFYGGQYETMRESLSCIGAAGCRFLVAGRKYNRRFTTLRDLQLPAGFEEIFQELPETRFRLDISSTERRRETTS